MNSNIKVNASLAIATTIGIGLSAIAPANAFNFTTNITTDSNLTGNDIWQGDIFLESVEYDGTIIDRFALVNQVNILQNDEWTGGNSGAASADLGDKATVGLKQEKLTESGAGIALNNRYLSSIIDTEDSGTFKLNLFFDRAVDNLFFFERGQNSKLDVQALDGNGQLTGDLITIDSSKWQYAGYKLNTQEIGGTQNVGSLGINFADLGLDSAIYGVQVSTKGSSHRGPDFKVVGSKAQDVPEPITGLVLAAGMGGAALRRAKNSKKS